MKNTPVKISLTSNSVNNMKKHLKFTIGLLVTVMTFSHILSVPAAYAQTGDASGQGGAVMCRNGARDWGNFLSAVISYDGFVEYWKDILVRYNANMCLYLDIDNLLNRIEKARTQIRNAFYICDSRAPKLAKTYHELEAELYFLRKYVEVGNGNILINSEKGVSNDFINYFVYDKNFFSLEESRVLLEKFISKYKARQETYKNCSDPTWGNLIAKWNEFKENLGGFAAVKEAAESITKKWDKIVNTPFKRTGGMFGGFLDAKINGLDPETAWSDIAGELDKNTPKGAPSGFTFDQFKAATASESARYNDQLTRTQYLAQYQQLYQESSDSIVKEIIDRVNYLEQSIISTFPFIDQTAQCTKGVLDKVCS